MSTPASDMQAASGIIRALRMINQLTLEAMGADSRQGLFFRILNNTLMLVPYNRAVLFSMERGRVKLCGISGQSEVASQAPLVKLYRELAGNLTGHDAPRILGPDDFPAAQKAWQEISDKIQGGKILWLPITADNRPLAGLWLERWGAGNWGEDDINLLSDLMRGYATAWRKLAGPGFLRKRLTTGRSLGLWVSVMLLLTVIMFLVPVRLRVVAPCEVVAKNPRAVCAPISGMIDRITVEPGERVRQGDLLLVYDKRVVREEVKIQQQQVEIIQANLARARAEAFTDASARSRLQDLQARLAQEQVRLRLAMLQAAKLEVRAAEEGVIVLPDPHSWRGRAVRLGDRIMTIVDPGKTMVRVWVPEKDNITFAKDQPASIMLNVRPLDRLQGHISYIAPEVRPSPSGIPGFVVEMEWVGAPPDLKLGLKGTTIIYGRKTCIAYWLLRKPIAAIRRVVGL